MLPTGTATSTHSPVKDGALPNKAQCGATIEIIFVVSDRMRISAHQRYRFSRVLCTQQKSFRMLTDAG